MRRTVPIARVLRAELLRHRMATTGDNLVFGRSPDSPFAANSVAKRAQNAWRAAGVQPISFHECRHTFASFAIAAGVNAKALSSYMGHSSVAFTMDRYGHLMPGNEAEAGELLDGYLDRAVAAASTRS
jgi:integrase